MGLFRVADDDDDDEQSCVAIINPFKICMSMNE